jgi:hypothetical protein
MKRSVLLAYAFLIIGFLAPEPVDANPCSYPQRMVGGHLVDLRPLMNWWPDPKGPRPLSSWKHVRGAITQDTAMGWVVTGKAGDHSQASTFFLKNPPREKLRRFQQLQQQLPEQQRTRAATIEFLKRPVITDWYGYWSGQWTAPPISVTEYQQATALLSETDNNINWMREELASMQDKDGHFKLDAFALKLNETYEGLPAFDHGSPYPFH